MIYTENPKWQEQIAKVYEHSQGHILRFWEQLSQDQKANLIDQINDIDFNLLKELSARALSSEKDSAGDNKLEPAEFITLAERKSRDAEMKKIGEQSLRDGKVAAFLVAGGQGTRLGYDGPKGMYPATPVRKKSLFQLHAEKLMAMGRRYGVTIPWYIMTSTTNDEPTRQFFRENQFFGYNPDDVFFMVQEMIPAIDREGKLILDARDHIFKNPNGHGGSVKALWKSGAVADMRRRGVDTIFYFQVDNVLTRICDPVYLGYHKHAGSEMSNKVVRKKYAGEKMGVLCMVDGHLGLVEYSDFDENLKNATYSDGSLQFWAGNIATHIFDLAFIERENQDGFRLPYHIAEKNIPFIDHHGQMITPEEKNGIKFESFVFDALYDVRRSVSIEIERDKEFSPLKNSDGENSPATVYQDLKNTYGRWLESAGFPIPRDNEGNVIPDIEISPLFALDEAEVVGKKEKILMAEGDIYLE